MKMIKPSGLRKMWMVVLVVISGFFGIVQAEAAAKVLVETDPATFAMEGYAVHLRVKPESIKQWALGFGVYALDFPDILVDLNSKNKNKGWDVRLVQGYGPFMDYYFSEDRRGWLVGVQAALQRFRLKNTSVSSSEASFTNLLIMPRVGYQWFPGKSGFYLFQWFGMGYTTKLHGNTELGTLSYNVAPSIFFGTLHVGYEF